MRFGSTTVFDGFAHGRSALACVLTSMLFGVLACGPGNELDPAADVTDVEADAGVDVSDALDDGTDTDLLDATEDADIGMDTQPPTHPAVYTDDRTQSPLTPHVAQRLRDIAGVGARQDRVFAKIGDSHTVSQNFMHCFGGESVELDGRTELEATIDYFGQGDAAGTSPYERESTAAVVGWSAVGMIDGSPSRFQQELDALDPRIGLVQFGTNDIGLRDIYGYHDAMAYMADTMIARGTIPVFTSIPPRDDDAEADRWVPRYNAVMRGIAQSRQFPFVDLHRELVDLPGHGLAGDGVHLNVYRPSGAAPCDFTSDGLEYGNNVRNLLTMQALDRVRRTALADQAAPDEPGPQRTGSGTTDDPIRIDGFPFTDVRDTSTGGQSEFDFYDGCAPNTDESGPEFVYRVELSRRANLRAFVFDEGEVDIDLHVLESEPTTGACIDRDHRSVSGSYSPGVYYFTLDSFVSDGDIKDGRFLFVLLRE